MQRMSARDSKSGFGRLIYIAATLATMTKPSSGYAPTDIAASARAGLLNLARRTNQPLATQATHVGLAEIGVKLEITGRVRLRWMDRSISFSAQQTADCCSDCPGARVFNLLEGVERYIG
jgi:hypothetical protein